MILYIAMLFREECPYLRLRNRMPVPSNEGGMTRICQSCIMSKAQRHASSHHCHNRA